MWENFFLGATLFITNIVTKFRESSHYRDLDRAMLQYDNDNNRNYYCQHIFILLSKFPQLKQ